MDWFLRKKSAQFGRLNFSAECGYTLIELLITIFIVSVILVAVSALLINVIRISQLADIRRNIRQDLETSLDVFRRDVRNAETTLSATECSPTHSYDLFGVGPSGEPISLDLVLSNSLENVSYSVAFDEQNAVYSLVRSYSFGEGESTKVALTSDETNLTGFTVNCAELLSGNKFLLVEVGAESSAVNKRGRIVSDVKRYTGVTIRNREI